jgi:hypothetical protein
MKFRVSIEIAVIEADSYAEAEEIAKHRLSCLSESNDGRELLSNAVPELYYMNSAINSEEK